MSDARAEVLARIKRATGKPTVDTWDEIPRRYKQTSTDSRRAIMDLLTERLHDYDAHVVEATSAHAVDAMASMLQTRNLSRMIVPAGFPPHLLPAGFPFVQDDDLSHVQLNECDGILTQSTLAIAETGTIVLQNVAGQGRRAATLVPDYHLCLVREADIVATVPEAIARLRATADLPTTFISGPSATADIEMTRIKGVHGPRFLDVVLLLDTE